MSNPMDIFGELTFNDATMQMRLPRETYRALKRTIEEGKSLDPQIAGVVANAMKDWALEHGATHYTHWFQPMTGMTAGKHDAFLNPKKDGTPILELGGKELVRGEPDASSFPSGGLRATFEARGYTAWDPTSYAFLKDGVLCIPTAFCSYGGEALDKKTPLLRSLQALNKQALRILRLFGNNDAVRVNATVGAEQEYFLVDKALYQRRPDLINTGRTLFGAKPPKGQELDDHYFGIIKPRVQSFMQELNTELWKLGVYSKTEHNEAAPAQHEMAPIFGTTNIAADHNQLTMELMRRVADRHGLACLLHEKPFAGVNGSGKHNNWSLSTDLGANLLEPGDTPYENAQFLLFLTAVIEAVDNYQDLLRMCVAYAGNDIRLGAAEAPPAIISVYLGDELTEIIDSITSNSVYAAHARDQLRLGVHVLPKFSRDTTDRNRTSAFAFTGNKFEFRSLGASQSISGPNVTLNTAVAESLRRYADELEAAPDFTVALNEIIRRSLSEHKRVIFNGNGYAPENIALLEARGLLNLKTTVDALPSYIAPKNVALFTEHKVFTPQEVRSRYDIHLERYVKDIAIEANTMLDMARRQIIPAGVRYSRRVAEEAQMKRAVLPDAPLTMEKALLTDLTRCLEAISAAVKALEEAGHAFPRTDDRLVLAAHARDALLPAMAALRAPADELETLVAAEDWPLPTYEELLTNV